MLAADGIGVIAGGIVFGVIGSRLTPYRSMMVALLLLFASMLTLSFLMPVGVSVAALALTGFGFGIMVPNNQTVFRRITDVEFRGRLLGVRDAVVGVSAPLMVVTIGLLLDFAPIQSVVFLLAVINLAVLIWYIQEKVFWQLNQPEPESPPRPQVP